jgi:DNA-binding HxlR family transcriptional regulator
MPWYPEGVATRMKPPAAAHAPALCTRFHHASELIGRRWNGAIIFVLLQQTCRFAHLRAAIPGITDRMLSERLQELEDEGLVERTVVPETPVRVEYSLTRKGKSLAEAIGTIAKWAEKYVSLPAKRDRRKPARGKAAVR